MIRKMTGLQSDEKKSPRQPIQLGPHSYRTLGLSILSCIIFLVVIWMIKMMRLDRLYKSSPLHKLVKILTNSPDLELEEDRTESTPEQIAARQRVLHTCMELERRMSRLEQSIAPLARSLQVLSDYIERGPGHAEDNAVHDLDDFQGPHTINSKVQDYLDSLDHLDSQVVDLLTHLGPKDRSDPEDHLDPKDRSDPEDHLGPNDHLDPKDSSDPEDHLDPKHRSDPEDHLGPKDHLDPKDRSNPEDHLDPKDRSDPEDRVDPKDRSDPEDRLDPKDHLDPKDRSEPRIPDFREPKVGESSYPKAPELVDFHSDVQDSKIKDNQDSPIIGPLQNQKSVHSPPQFTYFPKTSTFNENVPW